VARLAYFVKDCNLNRRGLFILKIRKNKRTALSHESGKVQTFVQECKSKKNYLHLKGGLSSNHKYSLLALVEMAIGFQLNVMSKK
jgi:hypothetical protein